MSKSTIRELRESFIISDTGLIWNLPTKGGRSHGKPAGGLNKSSGRFVVELSGKSYTVASIVWAISNGYWANMIEHINGDKTDDRIENLRDLGEPLEVTQELLKRIFEYKNGNLYWKEKPTSVSQVRIGEIAGYIVRNKQSHPYRYVKISGERHKVANLIWLYHNGVMPKMLDHINHDTGDDSIENVREVTHKENARNRKRSKTNTSGVTGVIWCNSAEKWRARINDNSGKRIEIGVFVNIENAIRARKEAEIEFGYHKNHGK